MHNGRRIPLPQDGFSEVYIALGRRTGPHAIVTDDAVGPLEQRPRALRSRMEKKPLREIALSEITAADGWEFLDYWASKKTGPGPPARRTLDPLIEKPHLVPCMYIYEVVDAGRDFRLRLVGTQVTALFGSDPTGRCMSEIWASSEIEANLQLMRKCMGTGEPVAAEGSYHWRGRAFIEWQCVITPLRLDGPQVGQFLCFLSRLPFFKVLSC
ncbi:hypothetical protein N825_29815 [Skermanella stibiiresistens SB22]|uniref:PAS domain-containing protein n=1 Tax=Skermanella stibiiresistens SB22 TaxID=1385369 RepID=W9GU46_9PROT|nr:PAS domain-containing protein [Skermanella stibiiresistens]EWY36161.1 hypothetical protein N825_29815 [Skermanella stibiiresistens SB22]